MNSKVMHLFFSLILLLLFCSGCGDNFSKATITPPTNTLNDNFTESNSTSLINWENDYYKINNNKTAYIPPQCYTKVQDKKGNVFNPCYSCHTNSKAPNMINDSDVQLINSFPIYATKNRWTNLFVDRSNIVDSTDDKIMLDYVEKSNYLQNNQIILESKLKNVPKNWDVNKNGKWDGYIADCYFNFDDEGFDHTPEGNYTGWRAFRYYPFLGTFWPTNGSMDDVIIRLDSIFMQNREGIFDKEIYKANLAIIEMLIKQKDINVSLDEQLLGVDLNNDKQLSKIMTLPKPSDVTEVNFVGMAEEKLQEGMLQIDFGIFPVGTEFLHSVRYLDVNDSSVVMAKRMKELRYTKKIRWVDRELRQILADQETVERNDYPNSIKSFDGNSEIGLVGKFGWAYMGFIEDSSGALRPQNYEELTYCMGCHGFIGATDDTIFSFGRKFDKDGWLHWTQKGISDVAQKRRLDGKGEYSFYIEKNGDGDEFRNNDELRKKFFNLDGTKKLSAFLMLDRDISYALLPSVERALKLDKAYWDIVKKQTFIYGRDATVMPVDNVHKKVIQYGSTGITEVLDFH